MSAEPGSGNRLAPLKASGWESHSTQGHLRLPLLTEDTRLFICESDASLQVPTTRQLSSVSRPGRPGWGLSSEHVALVPRRWDMATVGSSPVLGQLPCRG